MFRALALRQSPSLDVVNTKLPANTVEVCFYNTLEFFFLTR